MKRGIKVSYRTAQTVVDMLGNLKDKVENIETSKIYSDEKQCNVSFMKLVIITQF